jgi:hypothetical protein
MPAQHRLSVTADTATSAALAAAVATSAPPASVWGWPGRAAASAAAAARSRAPRRAPRARPLPPRALPLGDRAPAHRPSQGGRRPVLRPDRGCGLRGLARAPRGPARGARHQLARGLDQGGGFLPCHACCVRAQAAWGWVVGEGEGGLAGTRAAGLKRCLCVCGGGGGRMRLMIGAAGARVLQRAVERARPPARAPAAGASACSPAAPSRAPPSLLCSPRPLAAGLWRAQPPTPPPKPNQDSWRGLTAAGAPSRRAPRPI